MYFKPTFRALRSGQKKKIEYVGRDYFCGGIGSSSKKLLLNKKSPKDSPKMLGSENEYKLVGLLERNYFSPGLTEISSLELVMRKRNLQI